MSDHVFVVSEWLPKEGKEQELWKHLHRIFGNKRYPSSFG